LPALSVPTNREVGLSIAGKTVFNSNSVTLNNNFSAHYETSESTVRDNKSIGLSHLYFTDRPRQPKKSADL
jgi:hypothetical protein